MILPTGVSIDVIVALAAVAAYSVLALAAPKISPSSARLLAFSSLALHGLALATAMLVGGPRFGFAPALSVTVWLAALVYAVESHFFPQLKTRWTLSLVGAAAVLLALFYPGNLLGPKASLWLPLHWALGIASYGLFGVAVAHGVFMTRAEKNFRSAAGTPSDIPLMTLERLTFHFVMAGFALLTATLLVVMVFGEQLYGARTVWRWDHKTIFSVLSWLTFAVLLVGRAQFGWRGRFAVRMLYMGAGFLLLAYVGSRFVMEIVLERSL